MFAPHIAAASIQNHNHIRLEFKGIGASGFLGRPYSVCDLRSFPYFYNIRSVYPCNGEQFHIVVENGGSLQSGERVSFQYVTESNQWLGCPARTYCDERTCLGSLSNSQAANLNRCEGETFRIYARGKGAGHKQLGMEIL